MHVRDIPVLLLALLIGCTAQERPAERRTKERTFAEQATNVANRVTESIQIQDYLVTDAELKESHDLSGLRELKLDKSELTADGVRTLSSSPELMHLKLVGTSIDDEAAEVIAGFKQLRFLNLPDAVLTDEGLAALSRLESLELLRLGSPNVTDAGVEHLKAMPNLRFVHLMHADLSGVALDSIAAVSTLESLYVDDIELPDTAWQRFIAARPDVHIHVNQVHRADDPQGDDHKH